jgi:hypothetical protein
MSAQLELFDRPELVGIQERRHEGIPPQPPQPWEEEPQPWEEEGRRIELRLAAQEEVYRHRKAMARAWAMEIKGAWIKQEPCPITPEPRFAYVLEWAVSMVQRGEV